MADLSRKIVRTQLAVAPHTARGGLLSMSILAIVMLGARAQAAGTETCLTGTATDVGSDPSQIRAVRALVDAGCVCSSFDSTKGKTHTAYVKCAADIIATQVQTGALRPQCKLTVKTYYSNSTCGRNPNQHSEPCITTIGATGKIACAIKPSTKKDGFTPTTACTNTAMVTRVACPNYTHCLDAADTNGDLFIAAPSDNGLCAPTPTATPTKTGMPTQIPTATATDTPPQTATPTKTATPTQTPTATAADTPPQTPTPTKTATPTQTFTATATDTPPPTATETPIDTPTACTGRPVSDISPSSGEKNVGPLFVDASTSFDPCGRPLFYYWTCSSDDVPQQCADFEKQSEDSNYELTSYTFSLVNGYALAVTVTVCVKSDPSICSSGIERNYVGAASGPDDL